MTEYILLAVTVLCLVPLLIRMAPLVIHIDWERKDGSRFLFGEPPTPDDDDHMTLLSFSWPRKKPPEDK